MVYTGIYSTEVRGKPGGDASTDLWVFRGERGRKKGGGALVPTVGYSAGSGEEKGRKSEEAAKPSAVRQKSTV